MISSAVPEYMKSKPLVVFTYAALAPLLSDRKIIEFLGNEAIFVSTLSFHPEHILPRARPRSNKEGASHAYNTRRVLTLMAQFASARLFAFSDQENATYLESLRYPQFSSFRVLLMAQKAPAKVAIDGDQAKLSKFTQACLCRVISYFDFSIAEGP